MQLDSEDAEFFHPPAGVVASPSGSANDQDTAAGNTAAGERPDSRGSGSVGGTTAVEE